jgi:hypothetical protein
MSATFTVVVFDMAHTGDADGERSISGFPTLERAREYARRRTRASVEQLRQPNTDPATLRRMWTLYGEDCTVLGGNYCGSSELDTFIADPAEEWQRDWHALDPNTSHPTRG